MKKKKKTDKLPSPKEAILGVAAFISEGYREAEDEEERDLCMATWMTLVVRLLVEIAEKVGSLEEQPHAGPKEISDEEVSVLLGILGKGKN